MFQFLVERRSLALLVGLFVVCFSLMTLSVRFRGQSTLMERALLSLVGSAIQVADIPRKWSVELWQKYQLLKNAHEENIELRQKLQSLSANHAQMQELKLEIARLEKLLGASGNLEAPVRLARLVARQKSIYGESLLIGLGSRDGVHKNMPVMHQAGPRGKNFSCGEQREPGFDPARFEKRRQRHRPALTRARGFRHLLGRRERGALHAAPRGNEAWGICSFPPGWGAFFQKDSPWPI